jgi:hypothetical protein
MVEKLNNHNRESKSERLWRFGRNINILGAVAIGGVAALIPGPNVVLASWAGLNAVQAGGFELLRKNATNKRKKKKNNS